MENAAISAATELAEVSDQQIREALERILASDCFAEVPRLSRFLEFVVSETLAGRGDRLKGFVIACDVFDKKDSSDAQSTTIVRVEAGRLRRRMADYYEGEGQADPLRIAIPKGGYKPVFESLAALQKQSAEIGPAPAELVATTKASRQGFASKKPIALLMFALVALIGIYYWGSGSSDSSKQPTAATAAVITTPTLAVLPLEAFGGNQKNNGQGLAITESLIVALSKQPGLHVMALSSADYFRSEVTSVKDIGRELQVSHVIKGGYTAAEDDLKIVVALHDTQSGYVIWSDDIESIDASDAASIIDRINLGIARQLNLPPPAASRPDASFDQDKYALFAQARDLTHPPGNKLRVNLALGIFDTLIRSYPEFAEAYGGAAYGHSARVWWGHSENPQEDIRKTRLNAQRALELDSHVGLAYLSLGLIEMAAARQDEAVAYLQQAVDAQPSNSLALAVLAMFKVWAGHDPSGVVALVTKAIQLDPLSPRTPYWNILGVIQFHLGNYEQAVEAIQTNLERGGPRPATQVYYLAASMAALGRTDEARQLVASVNEPTEIGRWQSWTYRNFKDKAEYDRLMSLLEPLGVKRLSTDYGLGVSSPTQDLTARRANPPAPAPKDR